MTEQWELCHCAEEVPAHATIKIIGGQAGIYWY